MIEQLQKCRKCPALRPKGPLHASTVRQTHSRKHANCDCDCPHQVRASLLREEQGRDRELRQQGLREGQPAGQGGRGEGQGRRRRGEPQGGGGKVSVRWAQGRRFTFYSFFYIFSLFSIRFFRSVTFSRPQSTVYA